MDRGLYMYLAPKGPEMKAEMKPKGKTVNCEAIALKMGNIFPN